VECLLQLMPPAIPFPSECPARRDWVSCYLV
jgi:hypothetical protein